jgi:hypothetical protein
LSFSVVDVLLLANTKAAFEALRQRLGTHFNFVQANQHLQKHFRSATTIELLKHKADGFGLRRHAGQSDRK